MDQHFSTSFRADKQRQGSADEVVLAAHTERYVDLDFAQLSLPQTVDWVLSRRAEPFAYVVTPNVAHVVRLHERQTRDSEALRSVYASADLCLCDSRILAKLAKIGGQSLSVVPGSDLTAELLDRMNLSGGTVAIVGGWPDTVSSVSRRYPNIEFSQHIPPMGLRDDPDAIEVAAAFIARAKAQCTLVAVGSPQQELLAARCKERGDAVGTGLCIGASIDFLTGRERRAPKIVQKASLEWAYRLLQSPRRLWRRYLVEGPAVFLIARRWARAQQRAQP